MRNNNIAIDDRNKGDWNAHVGRDTATMNSIISDHGIGILCASGEFLLQLPNFLLLIYSIREDI